ncbi:MAG: fructose-bisphosphate aldolase class I [Thermoleophilaceae bacterium]|jgi:fructose-bisphosphate aldolase class I|nr:fructose-bisphosphate aldolase class I [Thermoleophilaceae bacterium]
MSADLEALQATAHAMVAPGKGILAADESNSTMSKRLEAVGVESTEESRRRFRELLVETPGAEEHISGVILYDETIRQQSSDGRSFCELLTDRGMVPGIKVDTGAKPLAGAEGEKVTEGLDGLRERLEEYYELGARFAKWRAVIEIGDALPSSYCIDVNAHALARYAALCQEAGIVPIVEPEVLMDGTHSIDRAEEVTLATLRSVFTALLDQRVALEGMILKPNMVLSGTDCEQQAGGEEVAARTLALFSRVVPAAVPGIAFLSGGQSDELASAHLSAMNAIGGVPWALSFSYGRALQATPLQAWSGEEANEEEAQKSFAHRARCNGEARFGRYTEELEAAYAA